MIRQLKPGDRVPAGEPRRYPDSAGYIRLRWKMPDGVVLEVREHRVFDGVVTNAPHVHHKNGNTGDNRPDNLVPVTPLEHADRHMAWSPQEAYRLYQAGWTLPRLAREFGVHHVSVLRALKKRGFKLRSLTEARRLRLDPRIDDVALTLLRSGWRIDAIAKHLGVSRVPIERVRRQHGIPSRRPGRPTNAEAIGQTGRD